MDDTQVKKLMEIAAKPLKVPIKKIEYESSVFQFIAECKIKSSKTMYIPFSVIYMRYVNWCKGNNIKSKTIPIFVRDFSKKFNKKIYSRLTNYLVSPEGFDITDINLQDAERFLQDVNSGKKKLKEKSKIKLVKSNTSTKS